MYKKEECPVCKNNEYFSCYVSSPDGYSSLINRYVGSVSLNVCTECGCVFVDKHILESYKQRKGN